MSLAYLTDLEHVRTLGALKGASVSGVAEDQQVEAAMLLAQTRLVQLVTLETYEETRDADLNVAANATKFEAFKQAEAYFSIARLPLVLTNAQMSATGMQKSIVTGQQEKKFASLEEGQGILQAWEREGVIALAPYLEVISTDAETGLNSGFHAKSGFSIMAI